MPDSQEPLHALSSKGRQRNVALPRATFTILVQPTSLRRELLPRASRPGSELLDYLFRAEQQRGWDRKSQRCRGLWIDQQIVVLGLFDGEFGGLRTVENLIYKDRRPTILLFRVWAIRQKPTRPDVSRIWIQRRNTSRVH